MKVGYLEQERDYLLIEDKEFQDALQNFQASFLNLVQHWNRLENSEMWRVKYEYPFKKNMQDQYKDVKTWVESHKVSKEEKC